MSARSPFRAVVASAAVVVVAAAALSAGTTLAEAAPTAPLITTPTDESTFTATTVSVSGDVQVNTDQEVTVWVDNDGTVTTGCVVSVPYTDNTLVCDASIPGPGKYELTATSVELFDPESIPSPVSNAVTVIVGNTNPALLGYSESGTVWNTVAPQLLGHGSGAGLGRGRDSRG